MNDSTSTNICARAEDMVTYLYGEATPNEAGDFEKHIKLCSSCRSELATFSDVREAMGEWRQQALGSLTSPAVEAEAHRNFAPVAAPARRRSALAAMREFFSLSPSWMRAATAAAVLVFCALAAIAVAYFVRQPQTVVVQTPGKPGYSEKEVEAKIADALRKQNEAKVKDAPVPSPEKDTVANNEQPKIQPQLKRRASATTQFVKNNRKQQVVTPRIVTRPSKMELASTDFLPFTAPRDEEKLPSLADLVDEDNE
jgi:anti-sigma factor RsiW